MNDYYSEPDGYCEHCGLDLDDDPGGDHDAGHRLCWGCWRAENRPEPPDSSAMRFSVTDQRYARLLERMHDAELRIGRIEAMLRARSES